MIITHFTFGAKSQSQLLTSDLETMVIFKGSFSLKSHVTQKQGEFEFLS